MTGVEGPSPSEVFVPLVPDGWAMSKMLEVGSQGRETMDEREAERVAEALLTPAEVAEMFRVNPKTVTRWARAGKITSLRTLGGHRRFRESEVRALLQSGVEETA